MSAFAEIKSVSRRADPALLVTVELRCGDECERAEFVILEELFLELDVSVGETDGEMISELERYSEVTAAYMSACSSFAYVQSSLRALYLKLIGKGFPKEISAEAINVIRSRGFVDEDSIAQRRAELMLKKLWGRGRIIRKLREEGFPDTVIEGVVASLDDVDFAENCASLIRKRYVCMPSDRHEREKLFASLSRLGYSSSDIKRAMRELSEDE